MHQELTYFCHVIAFVFHGGTHLSQCPCFLDSSLKMIIDVFYSLNLKVLEGGQYRLQHPWVGIVNRSQADINKNVDMIVARRKEREYFETSPEY